MILTTALSAMLGSLVAGAAALWANPARSLNRGFAIAAVHLAIWLVALHLAATAADWGFWLKLAWVISGTFVWQLWLLKETVLFPAAPLAPRLVRSWPWLVVGGGIGLLAFAPGFVSGVSVRGLATYGGALWFFVMAEALVCVALIVGTAGQMKGLQGVVRLELQLLLLGLGALALAAPVCAGLSMSLNSPSLVKMMPLVVFGLAAGTVWASATTRLLDARHILSLGLERASLLATVAVFVLGVEQLAAQFMPEIAAFVTALALGLWFAREATPWLQELFQRHVRSNRTRHAAFEIARDELRPEAMEDAFIKLLQRWGACERVIILMGSHGRLSGGGLEFPSDSMEMRALHALRWVTPERLARERPSPERDALGRLLMRENLGAMVASIGPSPALIVGLGIPLSRRPFTYPEIVQLLELAAVIENSLSRAHYLMKTQHAEQLATVGLLGASIAHEIRNPLVSIKTFVQLLPHHHADPAFRDKFFRLIGDEVGRIDRLTEQLLDLAAPRVFTAQEIELHPLLTSCVDLMAAKADDKGVRLITEFEKDTQLVFTDPNAVKQVMLNLGFNAIQALERHAGDRWLRLATRKVSGGMEVAVVDSGPGLTPEVWSRLFQPFQSTKSSGFGLGLAICKDILTSLQASINADPPTPGSGATFRIVLPCPPSPTS